MRERNIKNMLLAIDYKNLEKIVYSCKDASITFAEGDEIQLNRGIEKGEHVVQIIMPWKNIYRLGKYDSEEEAKQAFQKYDLEIKKGYPVRIINSYSAEILHNK